MPEIDSIQRRDFVKTAITASIAIGDTGFLRAQVANTGSSDWITVTATITLRPENANEAIAAIQKMVASVREQESGVLAYVCSRSLSNPNELMVFEIYENEEATRFHRTTEHMREFQASTADYFLGEMQIAPYSHVAGFQRFVL